MDFCCFQIDYCSLLGIFITACLMIARCANNLVKQRMKPFLFCKRKAWKRRGPKKIEVDNKSSNLELGFRMILRVGLCQKGLEKYNGVPADFAKRLCNCRSSNDFSNNLIAYLAWGASKYRVTSVLTDESRPSLKVMGPSVMLMTFKSVWSLSSRIPSNRMLSGLA